MKNILFFGDSLTTGYGLRNADEESFPALIGQKISIGYPDYKVINAGLSGDTSAGGLKRLDYWISQPINIFVLELGINDILRSIPPQITLQNLQAIINRVKTKYPEVKIALMGMRIPEFLHSQTAIQFRGIFKQLADKNQTALVPFFLEGVAGKASLNLPDHIHPNAAGYQIIAEKVWPIIRGLLIA
jgi:acyl-CoA thioesterase-1